MKLNTKRLKEEIDRNNLTQRKLADKVGVTEVSMSRYVHGGRIPRGNILVDIAKALRITPEYLTGMSDDEPSDVSYAEVWVRIKAHGKDWTKEDKQRLVLELFGTM